MPFSAGTVHSALQTPQSGQPGRVNSSKSVKSGLGDFDIVDRGTMGQNTGNPYGIPGIQGPSINIGRVAGAIRGREAPQIIAIDRRIDPQYSNQGHGKSVHGRQQHVPGKQDQSADPINLNEYDYASRLVGGAGDRGTPEYISRHGDPSRLAGGQTEGVGMQDTTRSSQGLNESPAPTRIPRFWNDGLNAGAGLSQYGFTQQNYRIFIKHPWLGRSGFPTRGIRAVSGVTAQMSTASTVRIPAIYVPSAVG
jgi:hypothetical protein